MTRLESAVLTGNNVMYMTNSKELYLKFDLPIKTSLFRVNNSLYSPVAVLVLTNLPLSPNKNRHRRTMSPMPSINHQLIVYVSTNIL